MRLPLQINKLTWPRFAWSTERVNDLQNSNYYIQRCLKTLYCLQILYIYYETLSSKECMQQLKRINGISNQQKNSHKLCYSKIVSLDYNKILKAFLSEKGISDVEYNLQLRKIKTFNLLENSYNV